MKIKLEVEIDENCGCGLIAEELKECVDYYVENDLSAQVITIRPPGGDGKITLDAAGAKDLINQLNHQIQGWK